MKFFALPAAGSQTLGILCVVSAWLCFSSQDVAVKWISGDYALHQITLTRALIAIVFTLIVFLPREGPGKLLKTKKLSLQITRGTLIVMSNVFFFASIVVISLGEAMAIFFVAPLLITVLSVLVLSERVGWRRWMAVGVGFAGVLIILRPGSESFRIAYVFPLLAALCYASAQIIVRKIGKSENAYTMSFYIQLVFIVISIGVGLSVGDGRFADNNDPSLKFLLRRWHWPDGNDPWIFLFIGLLSGVGGYLISQGYRLCEAGIAAPFEYVALPLSVMWSIVIWNDWPAPIVWLGISLIAGAGLYVFYREAVGNEYIAAERPLARHK